MANFKFIADYKCYVSFYKYKSRFALFQVLMTPGYLLLVAYRLYSYIYNLGSVFRVLGRFLWLISYFLFGCDINPRCKIEGSVIMPHPLGIVIGEGVVLEGTNVIYQNVTLGVNRGCYPHLNNVTVYTSSVICGDVRLENEIVPALSRIVKRI
ncbi:hypothetical protein [Rheinheimera sp. 1928-s]|uniref:serine O-acetyltransferase n=1 Tax=Rheinheimera sp. 1928-s TaxID=3033803 RepID=UPI0026167CD6|nr:hypothetical protein [Rheinheimera sp. 1928-s]MDF3125701.1 hypothetical protein [Rheinheimera sp. 1928-s]